MGGFDMRGRLGERGNRPRQLHDQHLRHDYDTLRSIRRHGGGMSALEAALAVRKELRRDTLAPEWLREYADETVQMAREEVEPMREP